MYCSNCGTQLPDTANYCLNCGRPQKAKARKSEDQWEVCKIEDVYVGGFSPKQQLQAKAAGPKGTYLAGSSRKYKSNDKRGRDKCLSDLISQLTADGWELVGTGDSWYEHTFRRRVK
jgi:hypothetical protein